MAFPGCEDVAHPAALRVIYFFVVSMAVDSFPMASAAALFLLDAARELVTIRAASNTSRNLAFMAWLL